MQKKDFIIPGVVIVLALAIGIWLVVHSIRPIAAILPPVTTSTTTPIEQVSTSTHPTTPSKPVGGYYPYGSVVLALNQVAGFKDSLSIRPTAVLEDSRCPVGVQCIQAGTVRITLKTTSITGSESHDVALGKLITIGSDDITFVSVTPPHTKDGAPMASAYRFTLRIEPHTPASTAPISTKPCYVGGCSSELCSEAPGAVSSCIYRSEYACYKTATCERQTTGKCGWTQSNELLTCLQTPSAT
ncbi:MAG: hypothetical protein JWN90_334 [Parcubacteria group bacterium]|nr:hypothetical protein [Parcubacteria group bacterium]